MGDTMCWKFENRKCDLYCEAYMIGKRLVTEQDGEEQPKQINCRELYLNHLNTMIRLKDE